MQRVYQVCRFIKIMQMKMLRQFKVSLKVIPHYILLTLKSHTCITTCDMPRCLFPALIIFISEDIRVGFDD